MTDPVPATIAHPAPYVTRQAIAFGSALLSVEATQPLPVPDRAYAGVVAMTVGVEQAAGRGLLVTAIAAGQVAVGFADGSEATLPLATCLTILPFAVRAIVAQRTTAVASYASLI